MRVNIKYFASIREALGLGDEIVETDARSLGDLRKELIARGEPYSVVLARGRSVRVALNQLMCDEEGLLSESCEVAFFPPVTGG